MINSGPWLRTTAITPGDVVGRTQNLNIGGMFSSLANIVQRRISQLRRNDDFTDVTEADVFTSQGVALDIFGSGDLARRNFASLPFGNNMAVNSDFSSGLTGWASTASNFGLNLAGFSGSRNVFYATQSNLSSGAYADVFFSDTVWEGRPLANSARFGIPCVQNDRVFVRALLARHRCDSVLYLLVFNSAGVLVQADEIAGGRNYGGAGGDPANFDDVSGVFTVMHPQSSFAILMVRQLGTGEADPYIFVAEPMIGKLAPGQSAIPAYTPGRTDPMADVTSQNPALDVINSGPWLRTTAITPGDVVGRTQNLNIGGMFSSLANIVQRRISQLRRNDDFTDVTEADVFTSQGVALDIFGSGDLARRNFASLPFGNNMAVNSDFSSGLTGWASTASNFGLNLAGFSGSRNVFYATQSNLSSGAYADVFFSDTVWEGRPLANSARFGIPCVQNDRVFVRALLARHRCDSVLYLLVFNSAGVLVQADEIAGGRNYGGAGGDPANFDDVSGVFTVMHPQSSFAILMVRQLGTGEADPYIFVAEPMIGKLAPGQSAIPAYTPGRTDPMADVTSQNVAFDIQGATAWTRYNGIQPFQVNGRLSRIFDNGRVSSPRGFYNSQMILGPSNVTNLQPSYVQNANNVTVMLPAHTRTVTDAGPVALSYGGVSGTVAFSTYWAAFVDDPEMTGLASPIAGFTSNPEDLMYPGRYHIASGYSPDASGRGGSTGTGGGGSVEFPLP